MNEFWKGVIVGKEISDLEREGQRRSGDINIVENLICPCCGKRLMLKQGKLVEMELEES